MYQLLWYYTTSKLGERRIVLSVFRGKGDRISLGSVAFIPVTLYFFHILCTSFLSNTVILEFINMVRLANHINTVILQVLTGCPALNSHVFSAWHPSKPIRHGKKKKRCTYRRKINKNRPRNDRDGGRSRKTLKHMQLNLKICQIME